MCNDTLKAIRVSGKKWIHRNISKPVEYYSYFNRTIRFIDLLGYHDHDRQKCKIGYNFIRSKCSSEQ